MVDEKEIRKAGKEVLSISLKIAKEKQKLVGECFRILKLAAIKTNQKIDEGIIADKIYQRIKEVDNERIKKLFTMKGEKKKKEENKIISEMINSLK